MSGTATPNYSSCISTPPSFDDTWYCDACDVNAISACHEAHTLNTTTRPYPGPIPPPPHVHVRNVQVCQNAMKQYRRTRPDPSGRAIARAKLLDRGETHPLLVGFEARGMHSAAAHAGRNQFMRAMSRCVCVCLGWWA